MTAQGKERGTYMRLADGDHRLDTYSVFQLSVLTVPSEADREPVPEATIADLDTDLVDHHSAAEDQPPQVPGWDILGPTRT